VGVLVLIDTMSWYLGAFSPQSVAGVQGLSTIKVGLLPVVRPGLIGVDAAEHLVSSCSVHHNVLPCRGWDLAEEEVDFSRRSLFVVVCFVAVAAVARYSRCRCHCRPVCVCVGGYCMVCMWWWCFAGGGVGVGGWGGEGGRLRDREPPTGLGVLNAPVVLQLLCELQCPAPLPWWSSSPSFPLLSGSCWLFQLPLPPGPSSPGAKPKPFGPLLPGFLARQRPHAFHDSSTCGKVRPHAGQRGCCTYLEVWPEAWIARGHACSSLAIWAHRRVVEVACELLGAVEAFEEGPHASARCAERPGCALVRPFDWAWASGAVEPLLPLQTACMLGMIGL
jgi:hypothetical protein